MSDNRFLNSLNNAIEGIIHAVKTQKHMKIHVFFSVIVVIFSLYLNLTITDMLIVYLLIALVITSELINTAVEYLLDYLQRDFHITIKYIKDICAGAVLFNAIIAVICGIAIFSKYTGILRSDYVRSNFIYLSLLSIFIVTIMVIAIKSMLHRGLPLKGGMPSGHSAIAFSIWTSILMVSDNSYLILGSLVVAIIISFSRMWKGIHRGMEVITGCILGSVITYLVFLFYEG
ncbi:MAG: diacylglycerol kinase [Proteobacteria bacterium]|nr:diacylglycerol kinase [Pseudomonadota bacterium]